MRAWSRLTAVLLSIVLLAACGSGGNGNGGGGQPPVTPDPVLQEIRLEPVKTMFPAGTSQQYTATGVYSDGSEQNLSSQAAWEITEPEIAEVDAVGLVTGIIPGDTDVIATFEGVRGAAWLTITEPEVVSMSIYPPAARIKKSTTQDYRAFAVYSDGSLRNVTFEAVWSLENESGILAPYEPILTRGLNGLDDFATAIAVEVGEDALVASLPEESSQPAARVRAANEEPSRSARSAVNVTEAPLVAMRIAPRSESVLDGGTIQYSATGLYADGSAADLTKVVEWASAESAVITVSNSPGERGLARAQSPGETQISATFSGLSDATDVTVIDYGSGNPLEKIDVFPAEQTINVGGVQQYQAIAYLADGTAIDITRDSLWESSEPDVAVIGNSTNAGLAGGTAPGLTAISATFDSESGTASLEVRSAGDGELEVIVVEPADTVLQSFTSQQFKAFGQYSDGSTRDITSQVIWLSEDDSIIQVSNAPEFGIGNSLALNPGSTQVVATVIDAGNALSGFADVEVIESGDVPAQLVVEPAEARALVGDNQQYTATLILTSGFSQDVTSNVAWSSTEPSVAQVNDSGLAIAESAGEADIVATLVLAGNALTSSGALTVLEDVSIDAILVDPPQASIIVDDSQQYTARALLSDGSSVDVSDAVSWSSSDSEVAQIDLNGVARGRSPGTATIVALLDVQGQQFKGEASLRVKQESISITNILVSPLFSSILVGEQQQYTAFAILSDGSRVEVTEDVTWSTAAPDVAFIDSTGLATGISAGETDVFAQLVIAIGEYTGRAVVTVLTPTIESVDIVPTSAAAPEGTVTKFSAIATLNDGSSVDVSEQAVWFALDPQIAITDSTGSTLALSEGETGVFFALEYNDQRYDGTADFTVTASNIGLDRLQVEPAVSEIVLGATQQYAAVAHFNDGSSFDVTSQSDWFSSDQSVAPVNSSGLATGVGPGFANIGARFEFKGVTANDLADLTVIGSGSEVDQLIVSPPKTNALPGQERQYTATIVFEDGSSADVTEDATWTSGDPAIASVEADTGFATAISAGTTEITATFLLDEVAYSNSGVINVLDADPDIRHLVVEPTSATIIVGGSQQYTATVVYTDDSTQDVTDLATWSSSDPDIGWVDESGLATGLVEGAVDIVAIYSIDGDVYDDSGRLRVVAEDAAIDYIEVEPAATTVLVGGKQQYTATAHLNVGSEIDITADVSWLSDDDSVAEVNAQGRALGIAPGIAGITATLVTEAGNFADTAQLTVLQLELEVTELVVAPARASVIVDTTQAFTATAIISDGSQEDVTNDVTWTSAEPEIAHVNQSGVATGLIPGVVDIVATLIYNELTFTDSGVLTVESVEPEIEEIVVSPPSAEILVDGKLQYSATAILSDGSSQDVTGDADWSSSDPDIAQVNANARAQGVAPGQVEVRAALQYQGESYLGVAQLTVLAPEVEIESLVVDPPAATVLAGTTQAFTATVLLSDGSSQDVTDSVDWASTVLSVARVDDQGVATGLTEGQSDIVATLEYEGETYTDSGRLTVEPRDAEIIEDLIVEPLNAEVLVDGKVQFTAWAILADNERVDVTRDATWLSADRDIAEINQLGRATGIAAGAVSITANLVSEGELYTGRAALAVSGAPVTVESIYVEPVNADAIVGTTLQFAATALLSDGTTLTITEDVTWQSLDPSIAQVNSSGLATALASGKTEIEATLDFDGALYVDSGRISVAEEEVTLEDLLVTPLEATVLVGNKQQYTATAILSDGSRIDVTTDASWQSSDDTVAHINAQGRATGIAEGLVNISATLTSGDDSVTETVVLEVKAPEVGIDELKVTPAVTDVLVGGQQQYTATVLLTDGDEIDVTGEVLWQSVDPDIATVSLSGLATGIATGEATITATLTYQGVDYPGSARLRVKPPAVTVDELLVEPGYVETVFEETVQFTATALLSDSTSVDVTRDVSWSSSDANVAQVDSRGRATAVSDGQASITATLEYAGDQISDSGTMVVSGAALERIDVSPGTASIAAGVQQQFTATAIYADGSTADVSALSLWTSSADNVATVDSGGLATAVAEGRSAITATYEGLSDEGRLTVTTALATAIEIIPAEVTAPLGTRGQLQLLATFSDGSQEDVTAESTWNSADAAIASVIETGSEGGYTTLTGVGTTTISADYAGLQDSIPVTVTEAMLASIALDPLDAIEGAGTLVQYTATGVYSDGSKSDLTDEVTWSSSTGAVATIDAVGLADTHAEGVTTITATWTQPEALQRVLNSISASTPLTVTAATVQSVDITPQPVAGPAGVELQATLTALYTDGTTADVTQAATWSVADELVATVIATGEQAGLVSLLREGNTTLTGSFEGVSDSEAVDVSAAAIESLVVQPAQATKAAGLSEQFKATAYYTDNTSQDVSTQAAWVAGDGSIASVDAEGLATGLSAGFTAITATFQELSDAGQFTVTDALPVSVEIVPAEVEGPVGTTGALTLYADFTDGSRQDVTREATWVSADPEVAVVITSGLLAGQGRLVGVGTTTGSATYEGLTDTVPVTVTPAELVDYAVTPVDAITAAGTSVTYQAMGTYTDGSSQDLTLESSWSSSDTAIAAVGSDGVANTYSAGSTTISATYNGISAETGRIQTQSTDPTDSVSLTVTDAELVSVTILPGPVEGPAGTQQQRYLQATYSDGTTGNVTEEATWQIADTAVASVVPTDNGAGLVDLVAAGTTQLSASLDSFSDAVAVTVTPAALDRIVVTPATAGLPDGLTLQYIATAVYQDGTNADVTAAATWRSSDSNTASVDASGLATGHAPGLVTISAEFESQQDDAALLVTLPQVEQLQLVPPAVSGPAGSTEKLTLYATFSNGSQLDVSNASAWSSADHSIASVNTTGVVTLLAEGQTTVSVQFAGEAPLTATVTVSAAQLVDLEVSPGDGTEVVAGLTQQYTATGIYSDQSTKNLTNEVSWSSSVSTVATIADGGLATAVSSGTTDITATYGGVSGGTRSDSNLSETVSLVVTEPQLVSVTILPGPVSGPAGTTAQLVLEANYTDGSKQDVTTSATWTSDNQLVATVEPTGATAGLVSLLSEGSATISAQFQGQSDAVGVTVAAAVLTDCRVTPALASTPVGLTKQFTATAYYSNQTSVDVTALAAWSTGDADIASVSDGGLVTGVGAGSTAISASYEGQQASGGLLVTAPQLTGLTIFPVLLEPVDLPLGFETTVLVAQASYSDGSTADVTTSALWTSSDNAVVSITAQGEQGGDLIVVGTGPASINASFEGQTDTLDIVGTVAQLVRIDVSPQDVVTPLGVGVQYTATGVYTDGSTQDLTTGVTWDSGASAVATIDQTGFATTNAEGGTQISASFIGATGDVRAQQDPVSGSTSLTVVAPTLDHVAILPGPIEGPAGSKQQLNLWAYYSDGSSADVSGQASWLSADANIASVETGNASAGLVSLLSQGTTTVSASFQEQSDSVAVTVTAAQLTSLEVTPANASVASGNGLQYTATARYSDGSAQNVTASSAWQSGDDAIARIDSTGFATGVTPGAAQITATFASESASTGLTVTEAELVSLAITPALIDAPAGTTHALALWATFSDNSQENVTTQSVWLSNDLSTATVIPNGTDAGLTTLIAEGSTTVAATHQGETATIPVTVSAAVLDELLIEPLDASVASGIDVQYSATGVYTDGSREDLTDEVSWSSSELAVARIEPDGLARTEMPGVTTITANYLGITAGLRALQQSFSASTSLTVTQATLDRVEVMPASVEGPAGTQQQLMLTAYYSDGNDSDVTSQAQWSSANDQVAAVSNQDPDKGLVSLLVVGTTSVTGSFDGESADALISVTEAELETLTLSPSSVSAPVGESRQFTATAGYSDGSTSDVTSQAAWISSAPGTVGVSPLGLATALAEGSADITATFNALSDSSPFTATTAVIDTIRILPGNVQGPAGTTRQLRLFIQYSDGTVSFATDDAIWTSDNSAVATVTETGAGAGLVSLLTSGSATITAELDGSTATATVVVEAAVLTEVVVLPATGSVSVGQGLQFEAWAYYSNGASSIVSNDSSWNSADPAVATVDGGGYAIGTGEGLTTISANYQGLVGTASLDVNAAALVSVRIEPSTLMGAVGTRQFLRMFALYSDGDEVDVTTQSSWSSADKRIAAVVPRGGLAGNVLLTGVGETTIEANYEGNVASAGVKVTEAVLRTLLISPTDASTPAGVPVQYTATGIYTDFSQQDLTGEVVWSSSDETIAVIGESGLANALQTGVTSISASLDKETSASTSLTVTAAALEGVEILPGPISGPAGTTDSLTLRASYSDGNQRDVTEIATWSSGSVTIASVVPTGQKAGTVSLNQEGVTSITASFDGLSDEVGVTVTPAVLTGLSVSPLDASAAEGTRQQFTATASYSDGHSEDVTRYRHMGPARTTTRPPWTVMVWRLRRLSARQASSRASRINRPPAP